MNEPLKKAVLIPCFNEELTIGKVIDDFRRELPETDIYVFNNNSTDRTSAIAEEKKAIVINENKQGKGYVMTSMFEKLRQISIFSSMVMILTRLNQFMNY